ncbi:MAG: Txe/YoeB family addiction module toxin [Chloroherpetonaceae bacterium]|nr:Txe/YoeB family addiction module toxin [Chloroherpetonaceae bacterium]
MRSIIFHQTAFEQFSNWTRENPKIAKKIVELIEATIKDPFSGIGKPEALKHQLSGCWSRRISEEHRLVYQVTPESILILSCKFHY